MPNKTILLFRIFIETSLKELVVDRNLFLSIEIKAGGPAWTTPRKAALYGKAY